jgi:Actin
MCMCVFLNACTCMLFVLTDVCFRCDFGVGIVVESGDGVTHSDPIAEGFALHHASRKNFGGRNVTGNPRPHLCFLCFLSLALSFSEVRSSRQIIFSPHRHAATLSFVELLCQLLREGGHRFVSSAEFEIARDIKEKHAFVAQDFNMSMAKSRMNPETFQTKYTLPDGQVIEVGEMCDRLSVC